MQITGGKYNSRKIKTAEFDNIKPTLSKTRQGIFNTLATMINFEGKIFFDMFSGSGIMGLEALSRGFKVIAFEKDKSSAFFIKNAYKTLGETPFLYIGDAIKNVKKTTVQADVIFIDPPYNSELYEQALKIIKEENKLSTGGIIILEHPLNREIDYNDYELVKSKIYSNKEITYLK